MKIIFRKIFTIQLIMIWFIPLFAVIFIGTLSRKHDEVNWDENRALMTTEKMSSNVWDGSFQADFETLLGDQLFGRDGFIGIANGIDTSLKALFNESYSIDDYDIEDYGSYIVVDNETVIHKGNALMDWKNDDMINSIQSNASFLNSLASISNVFVSPISQYSSHYRNLMNIPGPSEYTGYFKSLLEHEVKYIDENPWSNDNIFEYKLKTDSHNNFTYYSDQFDKTAKAMDLKSDLNISDEIIWTYDKLIGNRGTYEGVVSEHVPFRNISNITEIEYISEYWGNEGFSKYGEEFVLSPIFEKINNGEDKISHNDIYAGYKIGFDGTTTNLFFDFQDDSKDNLLVIGDSNSAASQILYASSYDKSWFIRDDTDKVDIEKFIIDNDIDDVLFMPQKLRMFTEDYALWIDEGDYPTN